MIDPYKIIEKYYSKDSELYKVLITHSLQVKNKALEIARNKPELKLDEEFIEEATMLHDIGIFLCKAHGIHCVGERHYIEHGYLGAELLRKEGLDRHALVCERHTGTGLTLETIINNQLPIPPRNMIPISLEEQVICYADKFFSKSHLTETHSIEKIRHSLGHYGYAHVAIFDRWRVMFE